MPIQRQSLPLRRPSYLAVWALIVFAVVAALSSARAQELSVLHSFTTSISSTTDGSLPTSSLVRDAQGNLYGTTSAGGSGGNGTVYKVAPDGTIAILHFFGGAVTYGGGTIADGTAPTGNLILASDGFLYGTTASGGTNQYGVVYKISTAGTYSIVHSFVPNGAVIQSPPDLSLGVYPDAGVIQGADGNFYGTTAQGGDSGAGVVFRIKADGTYTVIHDFDLTGDAASPRMGLVQDAQGNLYGASAKGGTAGLGAIYKINAQNVYSIIYDFTAGVSSYTFTLSSSYTASIPGGYSPNSSLAVDAGGNLYGTASCPTFGGGAVYKVTPQGVFTVLHRFSDGSIAGDGAEYPTLPAASTGISPVSDRLIVSPDGTIYGATPAGGISQAGLVFSLSTAGQFTIIHSFNDGTVINDGVNPAGVVMGADGNFYGTTNRGGVNNTGTVFKIATALPGFTSPLRVAAALGAPFTYSIAATEGPVTFSVSGLPNGFTFNGTNTILATPETTGLFTIMLTATNSAGSNTVPLVVNVLSPPVISSLLDVVGSTTALSYKIRATEFPTSFSATGLPPGVSVDPASGLFYGVPTTVGTYPVSVSASNGVGTGTAIVTIQILGTAPTSSQEYTQIRSFNDGSVAGEGTFPGAMTLGIDGTFYGVTAQGGTGGGGTIYNLLPSGVTRVVADFNGTNGSAPQGVIQTPNGTLYGTTQAGGSANLGTIFKVTPDGAITVLHSFGDNSVTNDGAGPQAGLFLASDGNFYGTTQNGGSALKGTVFQMTAAGVVTTMHSFGDGTVTNDGAQPVAALVQVPGLSLGGSSVALAGTTLRGGAQDVGTLFAISTSGHVLLLHSFNDPSVTNDGWLPHGALLAPSLNGIAGFVLYGTTMTGGALGKGTLFSYAFAGSKMSILHSFGDGTVANDGENPISSLVVLPPSTVSGGALTINSGLGGAGFPLNLCGTTQNGDSAVPGTVFSCLIAASGATPVITILHHFGDPTVANDGTMPMGGGVVLGADNNLYGTTMFGGDTYGTAFCLQANQSSVLALPVAGPWTCTGTIPAGMTFDSTTGLLSGVPSNAATAGAYSLTIAWNGLGSIPSQSISFQLNQTFAAWAGLHSVSSVVTNGSAATSPPDGVQLAMKYLFDIAPNRPMTAADHAAMPTLSVDDTLMPGTPYVALSFREYTGMTGMGVTLESSDDMVNWSPVPDDVLVIKKLRNDPVTGDPIMEMGSPMDDSPQQFLRLKVTPP